MYKNPDIKRQFKQFSVLGSAALPENKLKKVSPPNFFTVENNAKRL